MATGCGGCDKTRSFASLGPVLEIDDLEGDQYSKMSDQEKTVRRKLAAVYRLVDIFGWSQYIYNHITARLSDEEEHFFLNPFGLLYSEITASSLAKVDINANMIDAGSSPFGINRAGFILHSAVHAARPDIRCVIHIHTPPIVAVSVMKCGLLPLCQEALIVGPISYHHFEGILVDDNERKTIADDLGPTNKVMMLHNHGVVVCGETIEEAFFLTTQVVLACETQVRYMSYGLDNLIKVSPEAAQRSYETALKGGGGVYDHLEASANSNDINWARGELEFTALMRWLDKAGYRTGYPYRVSPVRAAKH